MPPSTRPSERRIFFPWEGRGGLRRYLHVGRLRGILLVTLAITGLIVIAVRERKQAGVRRTRATLQVMRPAVEAYMADHEGKCPPALSDVTQYTRFQAPPSDAWGQKLRLLCPAEAAGQSYVLESGGPDREPGGLDRIQ